MRITTSELTIDAPVSEWKRTADAVAVLSADASVHIRQSLRNYQEDAYGSSEWVSDKPDNEVVRITFQDRYVAAVQRAMSALGF